MESVNLKKHPHNLHHNIDKSEALGGAFFLNLTFAMIDLGLREF